MAPAMVISEFLKSRNESFASIDGGKFIVLFKN